MDLKIVDGVHLIQKEQELIDNIASGDTTAFEQLFDTYWQFLHNVAYNRLQSIDVSDDLVQEVFVDFWDKRDTIDIHTSLEAYLYQSIKYKIFNHIRHQAVRQKEEYEVIIRQEYYSQRRETHPDDEVEARELQQIVNQELGQLSEKTRQIFQMSRTEHYTYQQIADQLDCSVKTVEYHISKVLSKLRVRVAKFQAGLL